MNINNNNCDSYKFVYGDFNYNMILSGGVLSLQCTYKDYREWMISIDRIYTIDKTNFIEAMNVYKIIYDWMQNEPKMKGYFKVELPKILKDDSILHLIIIQINPLKELEIRYSVEFTELHVKDDIRFQKQLDEIFEKLTDIYKRINKLEREDEW